MAMLIINFKIGVGVAKEIMINHISVVMIRLMGVMASSQLNHVARKRASEIRLN